MNRRVVLNIHEPKGQDDLTIAKRLRDRNQILSSAAAVFGKSFKILEAPKDVPVAWMDCTEQMSVWLKEKYPSMVTDAPQDYQPPSPTVKKGKTP